MTPNNNKKVPEATILDLLEHDTPDLLAMTQEQIDVYLNKAILDQEEILKTVPKKKVSVVMDIRDGAGGGMSRKQAAEKRNAAAIDLPPEIAQLAAATQAMLFEAQQHMKKPT